MADRVFVIGGGVGGLSAAICLALIGKKPLVFEQSEEISEIGAGLQLGPNAVRILRAIGVYDYLKSAASYPEYIDLRIGKSGRMIARIMLGQKAEARWGAPYITIHRADLLAALLKRLNELSPDSIKTGKRALTYRPNGGVVFADGQEARADMVIAADGMASHFRAQMGLDMGLEFSGFAAWRAVLQAPSKIKEDPLKNTVTVWVGRKRHCVRTPICGGKKFNFVCIAPLAGNPQFDWKGGAGRDVLQADFTGFTPEVLDLIESAPKLCRWPIMTHRPLPRWSDGRIALLGDSAHPMVPSLAQGAAQAIEDAYSLAFEVKKTPDIEKALAGYFSCRIARVSHLQKASLANMRLFHRIGGAAEWLGGAAEWLIVPPTRLGSMVFPNLLAKRYDWIYQQGRGAL